MSATTTHRRSCTNPGSTTAWRRSNYALIEVDAMIVSETPYLLLGRLTQADVTAFVAERLARGLGIVYRQGDASSARLTKKLANEPPFRSTESAPDVAGLARRDREKGRLVSQTAFPVLRQPHISGRFQNLCTGGLFPGRILIGDRCKSGQSRLDPDTDAMVSHLRKMSPLSRDNANGARRRRRMSPLIPLFTGLMAVF